jgi:hypothetical protein
MTDVRPSTKRRPASPLAPGLRSFVVVLRGHPRLHGLKGGDVSVARSDLRRRRLSDLPGLRADRHRPGSFVLADDDDDGRMKTQSSCDRRPLTPRGPVAPPGRENTTPPRPSTAVRV